LTGHDDARAGLRVLLVVVGVLALVGVRSCDIAASAAECDELLRRYEALEPQRTRPSERRQTPGTEACVGLVSRQQAVCGIEAENLDRFEECFF
jgi:hypothetical protein